MFYAGFLPKRSDVFAMFIAISELLYRDVDRCSCAQVMISSDSGAVGGIFSIDVTSSVEIFRCVDGSIRLTWGLLGWHVTLGGWHGDLYFPVIGIDAAVSTVLFRLTLPLWGLHWLCRGGVWIWMWRHAIGMELLLCGFRIIRDARDVVLNVVLRKCRCGCVWVWSTHD